MKICLFCIAGLMATVLCRAQTVIDTVAYRFVYDVQLKTIETSEKMESDEHWLDIGKNGVTNYYSAWKYQKTALQDSIFTAGGNQFDILKTVQEKGIETSFFDYYIFKNLPVPNQQTVILATAEYLQYEEKIGQEWTLLEGDTLILGHPCNKAMTNYHGRTWEVWYAPDIPIADGPWKLCGLPGLIMSACDSKNEFIFHCMGIVNHLSATIVKRKEKTTKTTPQKAHRLMELIHTDFDGYMNAKHHNNSKTVMYDKNGRTISNKTLNWVFIEHYE